MSAAAALLDRLGRPGALRLGTTRARPITRLPTGMDALDRLLEGGLPRGHVTELVGAPGAGRTGLATAMAAAATRSGETIAWIDPADALDPMAAAAAGVRLEQMLWARPRGAADALRAAEILLGAGGFGLVVLDLDARPSVSAGVWPRIIRAAAATHSTLLVVAPASAAGTAAALGLATATRGVRWSGNGCRRMLLDGIEARVTVVRNRVGRPGQTLLVRQACA